MVTPDSTEPMVVSRQESFAREHVHDDHANEEKSDPFAGIEPYANGIRSDLERTLSGVVVLDVRPDATHRGSTHEFGGCIEFEFRILAPQSADRKFIENVLHDAAHRLHVFAMEGRRPVGDSEDET